MEYFSFEKFNKSNNQIYLNTSEQRLPMILE